MTAVTSPGVNIVRGPGARSHCAQMCLCAVVLGSAGLMLGARLDFGQLGLAAVADWCRELRPGGLDSLRGQIAMAPWTSAGMLIGCNLGMALASGYLHLPVGTRRLSILRFASCNAGMVLGMLLAEVLVRVAAAAAPGLPSDLRLLFIMMLGMGAGMWMGWWSVEWLRRALHGRSGVLHCGIRDHCATETGGAGTAIRL